MWSRLAIATFLTCGALSCSSPDRQCDSQFDCFGDEACVDGVCATQVVLNFDAARDLGAHRDTTTPRDVDAVDAAVVLPDASPDSADMAMCAQECSADEICDQGQCIPPPALTIWTLDGREVARQKTIEGQHQEAFDSVFVGIPRWGRNIQIGISDVSSTAPFSVTCDNYANFNAMTLGTTDNSWADLDNVPDRWKGPIFTGAECNAASDSDRLARWNLELTTLTARRVVGSVDIEVEGAGPRAGETLRVTSTFAVDLEQN